LFERREVTTDTGRGRLLLGLGEVHAEDLLRAVERRWLDAGLLRLLSGDRRSGKAPGDGRGDGGEKAPPRNAARTHGSIHLSLHATSTSRETR
jgi:hypothetical protein